MTWQPDSINNEDELRVYIAIQAMNGLLRASPILATQKVATTSNNIAEAMVDEMKRCGWVPVEKKE